MQTGLGWAITSGITMLLIILDGKVALASASAGLELCLRTVIPGLFPFLILSQWINRGLGGYRIPLLGKLLPSGCEGISVCAFLGGYPVGARAVGQAYEQGKITRQQGEKMLAFCNQSGPAFIFGVAAAMFSRRWMGWVLWGIQLLSALIVGICVRTPKATPSARVSGNFHQKDAMSEAVRTMGVICGWILLFRIILGFLDRWVLWLFPDPMQVIVYGLLELSNGCCLLGRISDEALRFVICSGLLSAGGICIAMQTASVSNGLRLHWLILGKCLQSLISIALSILFLWISKITVAF